MKVPPISWRGMRISQKWESPRTATMRPDNKGPEGLYVSIEVKATRAGQPHYYIATIALGGARCGGRAKDPVDALEEARQAAIGLASVMTGALGAIELPVLAAREPRQEKP